MSGARSTNAKQPAAPQAHHQRFSVNFDYPVVFTKHVFAPENTLLRRTINRLKEDRIQRALVFIDSGLAAAMPQLGAKISRYFKRHSDKLRLELPPQSVPGGEQAKNNRRAAERVMEVIAGQRLCRQSCVIAVGGGSALDIIGLAASLVHRGLRLIRIPTTVLAQNDSGVGVKNGIDAYGMKNFAGTFAPPFAVLIDPDFLKTLPDKYWTGGLAEAFKVAIIKDKRFFRYLCANAGKLRNRNMPAMEYAVRRSALIHLNHIRTGGDPFEFGSSRPLDFGHWCAHKLEVLSGYDLGHGQAVAIGIALDSCYAQRLGLLTTGERDSILEALTACGLPVYSKLLTKTSGGRSIVLQGMREFQEHLGGDLTITLPDSIGAKVEVHEMNEQLIRESIAYLRTRTEA